MGDVFANFLEPIQRQFPLPKMAEGREADFYEDYMRALSRFSDTDLRFGAAWLINTAETRAYPLPSKCVAACKASINDREKAPVVDTRPDKHYPEWDMDRRKLADRLIACPIGYEAAKEDWIWTLWDFIRINQRFPDKHEIAVLRKKGMALSKEFWESVSEEKHFVNNNGLWISPVTFIKMRKQIIDRLKKIACGEVQCL